MYHMMGVPLKKKYMKENWGNWEKIVTHHQVQLMVSMFNTCERQTDRYCADEFVKCSTTDGMNTCTPNMFKCPCDCDFLTEKENIYLLHLMEDHGFERNSDVQQKESCNECQFTCETKADLEKHTSEVHNKDCVLSRHAEGTDKSKNSVEEVKRMFFCPFKCGFSNEEEDLFLIHLTENHEFSK